MSSVNGVSFWNQVSGTIDSLIFGGDPFISADGTRIAFVSARGSGSHSWPDLDILCWSLNDDECLNIHIHTHGHYASFSSPSISADGKRIAFGSDEQFLPSALARGGDRLYLWTEASGLTEIPIEGGHSLTGRAVVMSANGKRILFDLGSLWTEGSGITQIPVDDYHASINADGTRIAFRSYGNSTGGNPDGNSEIFLWTEGSGVTQISNTTGGSNSSPSINADGTRIAFNSGNGEIFLWISGQGVTQITNTTGGFDSNPSINADGTRIAFRSNGNPTGGNPDGNGEIFLATLAAGPRVDLTVTGVGPGPTLINPVSVRYSVQGCGGRELFLVLNAPAMGIPWSYLGVSGWVPLPANLATITPYLSSGPSDGTYTLFDGAVPTGTYELYLGCDFVSNGTLNIDAGGNVNGVYHHRLVTVQ